MRPTSLLAVACSVAAAHGRLWGHAPDHAVTSRADDRRDGAAIQLRPRQFEDVGAKRVKLKYGPFHVPSIKENMGMKDFAVPNMSIPCTDCYITRFTADLEFTDGTYANANTSMWLHHVAVINPDRDDTSCSSVRTNHTSERTFAAGNERGIIDLTMNGQKKAGYYIGSNDSMHFVVELMNEAEEARAAVVTVEWDYVPGSAAQGFKKVVPVWIDVDGVCSSFIRGSEVPVQDLAPVFDLSMERAWTSNLTGEVVMILPHLHDGGVVLDVTKNGKSVCSRTAQYGESPGFISPAKHDAMPGMDMGGMDMDMVHISSMVTCSGLGRTEVGDKWSVKASYNMTQHPGMLEDDMKPAPVMGLAIMFIAVE